jgi:microtubule-associated protein-like 6
MITEEMKQSTKTEEPDIDLEIEYVYGYRAKDGQQNLRYSATGKAVYHTAALGVVLDPKSNEQKCFGGKQTKMVAKN